MGIAYHCSNELTPQLFGVSKLKNVNHQDSIQAELAQNESSLYIKGSN